MQWALRRLLPATLALPVLGAVLAAAGAAEAACPPGAQPLRPGDDLVGRARAAPAGTAFCLSAGEYRMQAVRPKRGQQFYGEPGAVLNGSRRLTRFRREAGFWIAGGQTQQGFRQAGEECLPDRPRCSHPEAVFVDDRPLTAVAKRSELRRGTFYFDYPADEIVLFDDPTGRTVEASVSPYAFLGGVADVVIDGLTIEKYSSPIQAGAVGSNIASRGWVVRDNDIRLNYGLGVTVGTESRVVGNRIRDNGEMGVGCVGDDILIEGNEISGNGFFAGLDPFWEGGGGKCALTRRLVVRGNYTHHNNAYGFWTDIDNIDTLYEGNRVEWNANGGLSHEISYAAVVRDNTFKGNGRAFDVWLWGGAIQIQNSQGVEVTGNTIEVVGGGNGIALIQQDRGDGAFGPYDTVDNNVHGNRIVVRGEAGGASGAIADHAPGVLRQGRNRFDDNVYVVTDAAEDRFAWVDGFYDFKTYRKKSGQDGGSRLVVRP